MALAHIATATPNWDMNEFIPESGTFKADIVTNITDMTDGYFTPSNDPGLGIDINIDEMLKHPYEAGGGETSRRSDGSLTLG
jgi:L-alanine-DL-glutamate epimerase-like enolase superfamily enzyme